MKYELSPNHWPRTMTKHYQAIIIGAGPGGYTCAKRIAHLGGNVALIERASLGGTCTNVGCIPTKTLVNSAELIDQIQSASRKGIIISDIKIDFSKIMARKKRTIQTLVKGVEHELIHPNIEIFKQNARIVSPTQVQVGEHLLNTTHIVIATGSEPIQLFEGPDVCTSTDILELTELPAKLAIIGGGVIGLELGMIFNAFGSEVTIIEALPTVLPAFDQTIQQEITQIFNRKGIRLITNQKAIYANNQLTVADESIFYDKLLVAVGRKPVFPQEDLSKIGIEFTKQGITVNHTFQTTIPSIFAIGDVNGISALAHAASWQGTQVAHRIMNQPSEPQTNALIPACVYTFPEIGSVGVTEQDCHPNDIIIQKSAYAANSKSRTTDQLHGFLKIIANKNDEKIIGVHILGERATDLIMTATAMMAQKATLKNISHLIFPHPTYSELFCETH